MKKQRKVISGENLPTRSPLIFGMVIYLMLEHFNAPSWLYGVFATILTLFWIVFFIEKSKEEKQNLFDDGDL